MRDRVKQVFEENYSDILDIFDNGVMDEIALKLSKIKSEDKKEILLDIYDIGFQIELKNLADQEEYESIEKASKEYLKNNQTENQNGEMNKQKNKKQNMGEQISVLPFFLYQFENSKHTHAYS